MVSVAGLREKKKYKLRQSVQREAFRLFAEQGYAATTVEQIAEAAEISTTTFYRYYSSMVDVVLSGEYEPPDGADDLFAELGEATDITAALRSMVRRAMGSMAFDRDEMLARYSLIFSVPELWAAFQHRQQQGRGQAEELLARWLHAEPDSYPVRLAVAGYAAAVTETLRYWTDHHGEPDLAELLDQMIVRLAPLLRPVADDDRADAPETGDGPATDDSTVGDGPATDDSTVGDRG
ncbi:TetR/AcrR family transcriptional regulator [Actinocatenispora sera]|uniref:TetR family transcriptional regulator n=1 Tax=Actinocatenispora sera TaxID=390989 RepID=A0A810KVW0_9ACTN|nr:TetR/AcrR family transcriptional regulator [Actinocatenispora sera]BCJ26228.1 TetR family transcriptional regulator [Actinocatenispora sera]